MNLNLKRFLLFCFSFVSVPLLATDIILLSADGSKDTLSLSDVRSVEVIAPYDSNVTFTMNLYDGTKIPNLKTLYLDKYDEGQPSNVESFGNENDKVISIYPNPVFEKIFLSGVDDYVKVEILDVKGYVVKEYRGNEIDVTSLTDGLYILTVAGKYAKFIKKSR
ncbi:MAG: T9SS type A sorting domain-containing protein [Paludibacteraceae bacterium]|nr:T9SS type A sorting domain-containing protein [Paludibacteraceae bacterium]